MSALRQQAVRKWTASDKNHQMNGTHINGVHEKKLQVKTKPKVLPAAQSAKPKTATEKNAAPAEKLQPPNASMEGQLKRARDVLGDGRLLLLQLAEQLDQLSPELGETAAKITRFKESRTRLQKDLDAARIHSKELDEQRARLQAELQTTRTEAERLARSWIGKVGSFSIDGVARQASVSCLFERDFMRRHLGYWDSVRFGSDSEMIARCKAILAPEQFAVLPQLSMLCLDLETSLTNHAEHGIQRGSGVSGTRLAFRDAWQQWHASARRDAMYLPFPHSPRRYDAPLEMQVDVNAVQNVLAQASPCV